MSKGGTFSGFFINPSFLPKLNVNISIMEKIKIFFFNFFYDFRLKTYLNLDDVIIILIRKNFP